MYNSKVANNITNLVRWGYFGNIVIYSPTAYDNNSAITIVYTHRGCRGEPGRNKNILEVSFQLDGSMVCGQNSQAGPLSHHINMMGNMYTMEAA
jgi:hypothetical protein